MCGEVMTHIVPTDPGHRHGNVTVNDLIPYTQYWFQIAAETGIGRGPTASLFCNTTQAGM